MKNKYLYKILLLLFLSGSNILSAWAWEGEGTLEKPYLISTETDLRSLKDTVNFGTNASVGKYYKLTADIDLSGREWTPIGVFTSDYNKAFQGTFDGGRHYIRNLTITAITQSFNNAGLFGTVYNATIHDLNIEGVTIKGNFSANIGGLIGALYSDKKTTTISNCHIKGTTLQTTSGSSNSGGMIGYCKVLSSSDSSIEISNSSASADVSGYSAGGLFGWIKAEGAINISKCGARGSVYGTLYSGGLIGCTNSENSKPIQIDNCFSNSNSRGDATSRTGGFIGECNGTGSIQFCYASGKASIPSGDACGRFFGALNGNGFSLSNVFYNASDNDKGIGTGSTTITGLTGKSISELKKEETFLGWDFNNIWKIDEGLSYPYLLDPETYYCGGDGIESNPYQICDYPTLAAMRDNINNGIHLANYFIVTADIEIPDDVNWVPIGYDNVNTDNIQFSGHFDGGNHTISNLQIDSRPSTISKPYVGFFGHVKNGEIKNLILKTGSKGIYTDRRDTGTLAGFVEGSNSTIDNCHITTTLLANSTSNDESHGGLVGRTNSARITNCTVKAKINSTKSKTGGLAGYQSGGIISNCIVWTNMTASGQWVGGMVGQQASGSLSQCYAFAVINARSTTTNCAGLIGHQSGRLDNSFARVKLFGSRDILGGLAGQTNTSNAKVSNSFVEGSINQSGSGEASKEGFRTGGIIGYMNTSSSAQNTVAMLDIITSTEVKASTTYSKTGRITSRMNGSETKIQNAYANSDMLFTTSDNSPPTSNLTGIDGLDTDPSSFVSESFFSEINWEISSNSDAATWNIWEGMTHPYLQGQSAPVYIESARDVIAGKVRTAGGKIVFYRLLDSGDLSELGEATLSGNSWTYTYEGASNDELYAVYYETGKLPSPFVPIPNRTSFQYYQSVKDGAFEYPIWQGSNDGTTWTSAGTPVSISTTNTDINKITVLHTVNFATESNDYKTRKLRVEGCGKFDFSAGILRIDTIEIVSVDEKTSGQLRNAGGTLNARYLKVEKKFVPTSSDNKTNWAFFALPFMVDCVTNKNGREMVRGNASSERANYYVKEYNGSQRASTQIADFADYGRNWTYITGNMLANTGYEVYSGNTLHFVSGVDDISATSVADKEVRVYAYPSTDEHMNWNFIANPYTMPYNLQNIPYTCYVYDTENKKYNTYLNEEYWIQAFVPFFIQSEGDEVVTFSLSDAPLHTPAVDELVIQLSGADDTDLFRIHFRDDATEGYDLNKDGQKLFSTETSSPQLYTVSNGINLAIKAQPWSPNERIRLPLAYFVPEGGRFSIGLPEGSLPENVESVRLLDKNNGSETELTTAPHSFALTKKEINTSRFELEITKRIQSGTRKPIADRISIRTVTGGFLVDGLTEDANLSLIDLSGQSIESYGCVANGQIIHTRFRGIYLLKIKSATQNCIRKLILQ